MVGAPAGADGVGPGPGQLRAPPAAAGPLLRLRFLILLVQTKQPLCSQAVHVRCAQGCQAAYGPQLHLHQHLQCFAHSAELWQLQLQVHCGSALLHCPSMLLHTWCVAVLLAPLLSCRFFFLPTVHCSAPAVLNRCCTCTHPLMLCVLAVFGRPQTELLWVDMDMECMCMCMLVVACPRMLPPSVHALLLRLACWQPGQPPPLAPRPPSCHH